MKRLLLLAVLTLSGASAMSGEITSWATATSKQQGTDRAIVFRYAKEFRNGFKKSAFPDRVIVVWKYNSDSGMPAPKEREAMDRMEDILEPVSYTHLFSRMARSIPKLRLWRFGKTNLLLVNAA